MPFNVLVAVVGKNIAPREFKNVHFLVEEEKNEWKQNEYSKVSFVKFNFTGKTVI